MKGKNVRQHTTSVFSIEFFFFFRISDKNAEMHNPLGGLNALRHFISKLAAY